MCPVSLAAPTLPNGSGSSSASGAAAHGSPFRRLFLWQWFLVLFLWLSHKWKNSVVSSLGEGDEVITIGGIAGKIKKIDISFAGTWSTTQSHWKAFATRLNRIICLKHTHNNFPWYKICLYGLSLFMVVYALPNLVVLRTNSDKRQSLPLIRLVCLRSSKDCLFGSRVRAV